MTEDDTEQVRLCRSDFGKYPNQIVLKHESTWKRQNKWENVEDLVCPQSTVLDRGEIADPLL